MNSSNDTIMKAMIALLLVIVFLSIYSSVFASSNVIDKYKSLELENYIINNIYDK